MSTTHQADQVASARPDLLRIHFLGHAAVQTDELLLEILSARFITCRPRRPIVVRKVVDYLRIGALELLAEDIVLVQEQDLLEETSAGWAPRRHCGSLAIFVFKNHWELQIESKSMSASCI